MKWLQQFMRGRYGMDHLGWALLILYLIVATIGRRMGIPLLSNAALLLLFYEYFRMLSKNTSKRYRENQMFLRYYQPISQTVLRLFHQIKEGAKYKQFTCAHCKQKLRVPRGRGSITVTCPKCHAKFEGKS